MTVSKTLDATPVAPVAPNSARKGRLAPHQPGFAGDALVLSRPQRPRPLRQALDRQALFASLQTFAQGAARALALVARGLPQSAGLGMLASMLEGDKRAISRSMGFVNRWVSRAARVALPAGLAARATRWSAGVTTFAGAGLVRLARVAPALNVTAAAYDTYKAVREKDPERKPAAWTNAGLSLGGTAMAVGAFALGATPIGWALGIGAAGVAAFQLVDNFGFGGQGTAWLASKLKA